MKRMRFAAAFACLIAVATTASAQQVPAASDQPVTVQQAAAPDPDHPAIPIVIWSPPGAAGDLPVIVISHGTGAGPISHVDTAEALARSGFVVVAPLHPGDNFQDQSMVGRPEWLASRARHVSRVIDFMLNEWPGRARLNPRRIGIFGFSAGATTALISLGGVPDLGRTASHCAQRREFVCDLMAPAAAADSPPQWVHDRRIAAAVLAAPGLGFTFEPAGLAQVRTPVQLWVGSDDQTVPYATNGGLVRALLPTPPDFHDVAGAVHLSFLAPCGPDTPAFLCQDSPGFDRAAFHAEFNRAVVDFFRRRLPS